MFFRSGRMRGAGELCLKIIRQRREASLAQVGDVGQHGPSALGGPVGFELCFFQREAMRLIEKLRL